MKYRLLAAFVGALCLGSCYSDDYQPPPSGYVEPFGCERFTSCATCTPVLGCGWCQVGTKGRCTSDPDRCARAQSFTWTWELAFCPAEADGGAASWVGTPPLGDAAPSSDGASSGDASGDRAAEAAAHE